MSINQTTIDLITENAKEAKKAWKMFAHQEKLRESFHLRPTTSGVTIVSTLPNAPMRGIEIKARELAEKLEGIVKHKELLLSVDPEKVRICLSDIGFKSRRTTACREEDVQAMFIRGMISDQESYENIKFVASELTLDRQHRFDVVGYKDGVLFIFELKIARSFEGIGQTAQYVDFVRENKAEFLKVLSCYPHYSVTDFDSVQGIAVLRYAANATSKLAIIAKKVNTGLWYYEPALSFQKV